MEEAIFIETFKNYIENVNDNADFVISLLKSRITSTECKLFKSDGIIEFLPEQSVSPSKNKSETSINSDIESKINKKDNCNCNEKILAIAACNNSVEKDNDKAHYKMWK